MKKVFGFCCLFFGALTASLAQHCPFDGLYTIAIRIPQPSQTTVLPAFYLSETDSTRTDSCRFNQRITGIRFKTEQAMEADWAEDPNSTRSRYMPEWLARDFNFLKGNQVVLLSMSQKDCMVPRGNEYDMKARHFVVRFTFDGREREVPVPAESIYSLCGTGGSWKRIQPLEIRLTD